MKKTRTTSSFESLESRRMLSVTANVYGGALVVHGDDANDHVWLSRNSGNIVVNVAGQAGLPQQFAEAGISTVGLYGGGGDDILAVGPNINQPAVVWGGPGADYLVGGAGDTQLAGHGFGSGIYAPATDDGAADILVSSKGETLLWGQDGNDQLYTDTYAGSGSDFLFGGEGFDDIVVRGHGGKAWAYGQGGHDTLEVYQTSTQHVFFQGGTGWDSVDYNDWDEPVYIKPDGATPSGLRYGERRHALTDDIEFIYGTEYGDYFSGTATVDGFYGKGGDDIMYGHAGEDELDGGEGNDILYGGAGDDTLNGYHGNDKLYGQAGDDELWGISGSDELHGGDGHDSLNGGSGNDFLYGGSGNDELDGESGNDLVEGNAGNDEHIGGSGSDTIYASDGVFGNDVVYADEQFNSGLWGNDVVFADRLIYNGQFLIADSVSDAESTIWWPF